MEGGEASGPQSNRGGHIRLPSAPQRSYVPSAIGSSDILSNGDGGPTWTAGEGSEGSRNSRTVTSEGRQSSRTSYGHTASTGKKSKRLSFGRKPRAAEVSWADKKSVDADKYTFFRDPTPPPAEEKAFRGTTAATTGSEGEYDYRYDYVAPPAPLHKERRTCGMRRRTLWILLAVLLVIIAVAVGVGVGVGASGSKSSDEGETSRSQEGDTANDNDSSTATTTTSDTTSSDSSDSSSETTSTSPARATTTSLSSCPAANNTVYSVPGSTKTFLRVCGIDYSGEFGGDSRARDIGQVVTKTMEDCIVNCAGYPGCTGCGWGIIQGDEGSEHRCWLKARLGKGHVARPGWDFAILQ